MRLFLPGEDTLQACQEGDWSKGQAAFQGEMEFFSHS